MVFGRKHRPASGYESTRSGARRSTGSWRGRPTVPGRYLEPGHPPATLPLEKLAPLAGSLWSVPSLELPADGSIAFRKPRLARPNWLRHPAGAASPADWLVLDHRVSGRHAIQTDFLDQRLVLLL